MTWERVLHGDNTTTDFEHDTSFEALIERLATSKLPPNLPSQEEDERVPPWSGAKSFAHALELGRRGDLVAAEHIKELQGALMSKLGSMRTATEYRWEREGVDFDCGRVVQGEPECWLAPYETITRGKGRLIRLGVQIGVSGVIRPAEVVARGATICAAAALLDQAGVRIEITAIAASATELGIAGVANRMISTVLIKEFDASLDLARLGFALASPAMLRRFVFAARELHPGVGIAIGRQGRYGRPLEIEKVRELLSHLDCIVPLQEAPMPTQEPAVAYIRKLMAQAGIQTEAA